MKRRIEERLGGEAKLRMAVAKAGPSWLTTYALTESHVWTGPGYKYSGFSLVFKFIKQFKIIHF